VQKKDLAFYNAKNELVFECKRTQIRPQKGAKNRLFCGLEPQFAIQKAAAGRRAQGGYTSFEFMTALPTCCLPPPVEF
jgi:hypothetical protein